MGATPSENGICQTESLRVMALKWLKEDGVDTFYENFLSSLFVSCSEALSGGPVDSRHFVLPTFCAVWREKLLKELLCTS